MNDALQHLQARLTYVFRDAALLERAVTHSSFLPEHPDSAESYERLEFLGDAVLQLILTEALFGLFPGEREGVLSKRRAALSKGSFLSRLAQEIGLDACLRLGGSEEATGGRTRASTLEDVFEALAGALYLDSDLPTARRIVLGLYGSIPDRLALCEDTDNPKGRLQELIQPHHGNQALRYEVVAIAGEDHAREYEVAVFLVDRRLGVGRGTSKKSAEEAAAQAALETLKTLPEI
ncbi:MAG TPA: ribonuclease III [Opitutaceae bacterium]|nr:ribonuclease III [Opitutaceae bacterium]